MSEFDLGPLELGQGRRRGAVVQPHERLSLAVATTGLTDQQAAFQDLQAEVPESLTGTTTTNSSNRQSARRRK